jgi:antitoxin ParD1/3/4
MPRSYALGARFETLIDQLVTTGRYNNASEVVRAGLRLLEDHEATRQSQIDNIRRSIEAERASGVLYTEDEVFGELEALYPAQPAPDPDPA